MIKRRKTRKIMVGNVAVGGGAPVSVQSMTTTDTRNVSQTVDQIDELTGAGCEIVRVTVKDLESAKALKYIKREIEIPLVADIHFDHRVALESARYADCVRLNPGNIYKPEEVKKVIRACKERGISIRIGANSGSIRRGAKKIKGLTGVSADMVSGVLDYLKIFQKEKFHDIKISLKASNIFDTVMSYRALAKECDYPFHLGITASGLPFAGTIKSAIGVGALLLDGIGDTIRVSLTADPVEEIKVGREILKSLGLRNFGPVIVSCPTCGRAEIDLITLAERIQEKVKDFGRPVEIAVMGCVVNGPGEAKDADIGIAGGKGVGIIFRKGRVIKKVEEKKLLEEFMKELEKMS